MSMRKFLHWIGNRPYVIAGLIFLALAVIGVRMFGWWKEELGLLLILYVIAIVGIRLDEISRKLGNGTAGTNPKRGEAATILAKLDEISHSLKVLNHYLAKLTAPKNTRPRPPAAATRRPPEEPDS